MNSHTNFRFATTCSPMFTSALVTTTKKEIVLLEEKFSHSKEILFKCFWNSIRAYLMGFLVTRQQLRDAYTFRKQHRDLFFSLQVRQSEKNKKKIGRFSDWGYFKIGKENLKKHSDVNVSRFSPKKLKYCRVVFWFFHAFETPLCYLIIKSLNGDEVLVKEKLIKL